MNNTSTTIQTEIETIAKKMENHTNLYNEGYGGYNPFESDLEDALERLEAAEKAEFPLIWTKETTASRRAWFNAQKFDSPLAGLTGCRKQGFEMGDLFKAIKIN